MNNKVKLKIKATIVLILLGMAEISFGQTVDEVRQNQAIKCFSKKNSDYAEYCHIGDKLMCYIFNAILESNESAVQELANCGISFNVEDASYEATQIPIILASLTGNKNIVKILLKTGLNLESKDNTYKRTALVWASFTTNIKLGGNKLSENADYLGILKLLISKGANVNAQDSEGNTALILNSKMNREDFVKLLLKNGADPNIQNKDGKTALMLTSDVKIVKMLISTNADLRLKDLNGNTALNHAEKLKLLAKVKYLKKNRHYPNKHQL